MISVYNRKALKKLKEIDVIKKGALTGLLLFGIFFGAGTLIFPQTLGTLSGQHFYPLSRASFYLELELLF